MSLKVKTFLLVGIFLIAAFAFAENGGLLPAPSTDVAAGQPATATALPAAPAAQPQAQMAPQKNPLGLTFGFDERVRADSYNNASGDDNPATGASYADSESRFVRMRTRAFIGAPLGHDVDFFFRVGNEGWKRYYADPPITGLTRAISLPYLAGEFWVDNLYLNIKRAGVSNLSLKIGRFDMITNEGFGFFTGNEGVGPRDLFFTGARLDYKVGKQNFALMAFYQPRNDFFPVVNGSNQALNVPSLVTTKLPRIRETLNEQDIDSFTFYYTNKMHKNTDIEIYDTIFHEYDMSCDPSPTTGNCTYYSDSGAPYSASNYLFYQPDRTFDMLAGRIVQRFPKQHFVFKSEFQGEFGTQDGVNPAIKTVGGVAPLRGSTSIRAFGEYGYATEYFQFKTKPYIRAVYVFLSGSKPGDLKTDGNYVNPYNAWAWHPSLLDPEGYQTPLFSDLYVYSTQKTEFQANPAYMTNLRILGFETGFTPFKHAMLIGSFQNVGAMNPYAPNPIWGAAAVPTTMPYYNLGYTTAAACGTTPLAQCSVGTGTTRYNMVKAELNYRYSPNFNFNISGEKLFYGDYWNSLHRNNAYYVRTEVNYTFRSFRAFQKN
jgi:hypothetical protein